MLTESTLLTYLDETEGWVVGRSRSPYTHNVLTAPGSGWSKKTIPLQAATNDEKGVYLRWFVCPGCLTVGKTDFQPHTMGKCVPETHLHMEIRVRTQAGGLTSSSRQSFIVPHDLTMIFNERGAPKSKVKITKSKLPEPFKFNQQKWVRNGHSDWERMTMLARCGLVGPVGITDNAKVQAEIAQQPDEEVWWHFDCTSPMSATFDIITDGETFYPLNRRSKRITTNLKPKSSVDLTRLSVGDLEMMLEAIRIFAGEL